MEVVVVVVCCLLLAKKGAAEDAAAEGGGEGAQPQPHFILIVSDDLGWNDVPWNNKAVKAPHMEALAREGVILEQSYVQPICTPTRSALLTGRYPFTIGRQHDVIRPSQPTGVNLSLTLLPEVMKDLGYSTHAVGKWHLGFCSWDYTPTERGFDTFYGYYTGSEDYFTHKRSWTLRERNKDSTTTTTRKECNDLECDTPIVSGHKTITRSFLDLRNNETPDQHQEGTYSSGLFASRVEELLARDPQVPLFLYLPFQSVHTPLQVPPEYIRQYSYIKNQNRRTKLGMVSAMDDAIGRVVTALKNTGHYNNSVIVFTTDNGGPTLEAGNNWPLRGNKTTLWEGGTRGAAFVHSPLLPNPGTSNPALIHVTDWFPTLVQMAGGVPPEGIHGVDQWSAITEAGLSQRSLMVYNIDNTTGFAAGVRMGMYKLLVGNPGPGEWTPPPEGIADHPIPDPDSIALTPDGDQVVNDRESNAIATEDEQQPDVVAEEEEESAEGNKMDYSEPHVFGEEVSRLLLEMSGRNDTQLRLYNLNSDPLEQHNVAATSTQVVKVMVTLLKSYMFEYSPADSPHNAQDANPQNFDGVWSPGWC
ncbi:arylsulfatase B-like [Portunus trituberculatus]|uniref:arylsulfatase B-like n=1 Tax=Portunus trituberculatus TaxID=210409 RepID=UPI001E1D0057|nr:arylsulfatase B-like [Portunus trituberculatus]